jgi:hypothetical protein
MAAFRTRIPLAHYGMDLLKSLTAAFILRGSACTINDIFDRKVDAGVGMFGASFIVESFKLIYTREDTESTAP